MTANPPKKRHAGLCEYIIVIISDKFKDSLFLCNLKCSGILIFKPGLLLRINRLALVTTGNPIPLCCFQKGQCCFPQKRIQSILLEKFYTFPLSVILVKAFIHRKVSSDAVIIYKVIIQRISAKYSFGRVIIEFICGELILKQPPNGPTSFADRPEAFRCQSGPACTSF